MLRKRRNSPTDNGSSNNNKTSNDTMSEHSYDSRQPLLPSSTPDTTAEIPSLYNADATLELSAALAQGMLILLSGGDDDDDVLAFAALTDGNVIDTCMGCGAQGGIKFSGSAYAVRSAQNAKNVLREAAEAVGEDAVVRRSAVRAYVDCFRVVVDYQQRLEKENVLCCCRTKKLRKHASDELRRCFVHLTEVLHTVV